MNKWETTPINERNKCLNLLYAAGYWKKSISLHYSFFNAKLINKKFYSKFPSNTSTMTMCSYLSATDINIHTLKYHKREKNRNKTKTTKYQLAIPGSRERQIKSFPMYISRKNLHACYCVLIWDGVTYINFEKSFIWLIGSATTPSYLVTLTERIAHQW